MYGKIFESIYDGTLADDWRALITFQQMIVLCNSEGIIDMTPTAISRRTGIPIEHIKAGLLILENEDPYSKTPDECGRRIVRINPDINWGWRIVNHKLYRNMANRLDKNKVDRERIAKHRNVAKCSNVSQSVANVAYTDADADTDTFYKTSRFIFEKIKELNPKQKEPNYKTWNKTIRLMVERDNRTETEIRELFEWSNKHYFWKTNILSPDALRKQWDKLIIQKTTGAENETHNKLSAFDKSRIATAEWLKRKTGEIEEQRGSDDGDLG